MMGQPEEVIAKTDAEQLAAPEVQVGIKGSPAPQPLQHHFCPSTCDLHAQQVCSGVVSVQFKHPEERLLGTRQVHREHPPLVLVPGHNPHVSS